MCYNSNMKILIPTAKELNLDLPAQAGSALSSLSQQVMDALATYTQADLEGFYKISPERANEEYQRIQALKTGQAELYPAIQLFDGLMYRNIKRQDLTAQEETYLRDKVLITSALYGVIPAFTAIAPHRLDFLMKLKVDGKSLKTYWKFAYDQAVEGEGVLLSLLSSEFETVFSKPVRDRMLTFKFMENRAGTLKIHSTISKKARGAFLTALMEQQVEDLAALKNLTFAGFSYREDLSSEREFAFVKEV